MIPCIRRMFVIASLFISFLAVSQIRLVYEYDLSGNMTIREFSPPILYSMDSDSLEIMYCSVYPNPTSGIVNIDLMSDGESINDVYISGLNGNVSHIPFIERSNQIDISSMPNGWYILSIRLNHIVEKHKILKR